MSTYSRGQKFWKDLKKKMLRLSASKQGRLLKRGMGPQNAYNDQPQFLSRTVLCTPDNNDNITINGQPFNSALHGHLFAGRPTVALSVVNQNQKNEGWHGLWINTQRHLHRNWWRRKVAHRTMNNIYNREMTRRVSFVNDMTNVKTGYPRL